MAVVVDKVDDVTLVDSEVNNDTDVDEAVDDIVDADELPILLKEVPEFAGDEPGVDDFACVRTVVFDENGLGGWTFNELAYVDVTEDSEAPFPADERSFDARLLGVGTSLNDVEAKDDSDAEVVVVFPLSSAFAFCGGVVPLDADGDDFPELTN